MAEGDKVYTTERDPETGKFQGEMLTNLQKVASSIDRSNEYTKERTAMQTAELLTNADHRADKEAAKKEKDEAEARANEERNLQILEGLSGFAKLNFKARLAADKAKKVAAGKIKDWGVKKLAQVKEGALKLLDMLKKGLGLAALWAVFWLIKKIDLAWL